MMRILEEFWYGNLHPSEKKFRRQTEFDKILKLLVRHEEKLMESLNGSEKETFEKYKDMLLIGGNNHRTGKKSTAWAPINDFVGKHYPNGELMFQWANQDCMSLDNIPYIGQYSKNTPNLYVATGFNKWGMTSSMVSAMILSDMIEGRKNDSVEVFSPQRSILKPQLFINGFESATNLLTPIPKRCSHLGCALKWNKYEHTWDCPCHGSRFEENGRIIDNPAMKNLKKD